MTEVWYPVSQQGGMGFFPLKSVDAYQDKLKDVSKSNFFCFDRCKSVNSSLLGYPCVFRFLNVGDGQL